MPFVGNTFAFRNLNIFLAVTAFLVSALAVNTFLSHILPRIFAESPRRDIYETPSLDTWVIVGKHGVTLVVSAWAGISTGQYFSEPHLREGRPEAKLESRRSSAPFSMAKNARENRKKPEAEARKPFECHTAICIPPRRPSTPLVDPTIQDWIIYEEHFSKPPPSALNAIDDESGGLSQSIADLVFEWNPELRQRYDPKD